MTYQQIPAPQAQCHPCFQEQYVYENQEYMDNPEAFMDAVSYSESDGYIGIPMVRAVPSHEIQELYLRKPMISFSQTTPQHSRCCFEGHRAYPQEFIQDLRQRAPSNLKVTHAVTHKPVTRMIHSSYVSRRGALPVRNAPHPETYAFRSSPTISTTADRTIPEVRNSSAAVASATDETQAKLKAMSFRQTDPSKTRPNLIDVPLKKTRSQAMKQVSQFQDSLRCRTYPEISDVNLKKMNSEGDTTGIKSDLNEMDTIERIVATLDVDEVENLTEEHKNEIKKISKFLVPRVPSSLKAQEETSNAPKSPKNMSATPLAPMVNRADRSVSLKQSLDHILDQLENCELSINAVKSKYSDGTSVRDDEEEVKKDTITDHDIFNLRDISAKISPKPSDEINQDFHSEYLRASSGKTRSSVEITRPGQESRTCLDDNSALELHRSKSYIVNLIDRALSRELGTIPNERIERKEFQDLNPSKAINQINRNRKVSTLGEDLNTVGDIAFMTTSDEKRTSSTSTNVGEEPAYIKQLKDLRWGHFKHIQQEVKRLEDLERFLDSCGVLCEDVEE